MRPALLALLFALPAAADEIHLKSGGRLSGTVIQEGPEFVQIRLPSGNVTLPRGLIERVVREDETDYLLREAAAYERRGAWHGAVELYERAAERTPEAREGLLRALAGRADSLAAARRRDEARDVLRRWLEIAPDDEEPRRRLEALDRADLEAAELLAEGRTALEAGAVEHARSAYERWRMHLPPRAPEVAEELAGFHAAVAARAAAEGDLRTALDHLRASAAYAPRDDVAEGLFLLAPLVVLEAVVEGDDESAREELDAIRSRYPDPAVPVFLDAVLAGAAGEVSQAVHGYAHAAKIADTRTPPERAMRYELVRDYAQAMLRASITRPTPGAERRWREIFLEPLRCVESGRFLVHAPTERAAREAGEAADEAYARAATDLTGSIPVERKAELVVHGDRQAYLAADPTPADGAGIVLGRSGTAGVTYATRDCVRVETHLGAIRLLDAVLPHEAVHVLQRDAGLRHEHWLHEGLAMLYEGDDARAERRARFARAAQPWPLRELAAFESTPPDQPLLFYDQAHSVAEFLRSLGEWRAFLAAAARNGVESAARDVHGFQTLEDLERAWRESLAAH